MILPKKITADSNVHLTHLSSPVVPADRKSYAAAKQRLTTLFPNTVEFEVEHAGSDPWYLAGSEQNRLYHVRSALPGANWLLPVYGGTDCADVVRRLTDDDVQLLAKQQTLVTGFSDATCILNWLYFKSGLQTIHYANATGLFERANHQLFLDVITGKAKQLSFNSEQYRWLSSAVPQKPVTGTAIGGNWVTFRDVLDIGNIQPPSWRDYILFLEEVGDDAETLHRQLIALDQRGIFRNIRALVVGHLRERPSPGHTKIERPFESYLEALLEETLTARAADHDPLYILHADDFGHELPGGQLILPIGAQTTIHPDRTIVFAGPFASD